MQTVQPQISESSGPKLTDWQNEPTIQTLKGDLEASKTAHDLQVGKIKGWNDLMAVSGSAKPKKVKGRSSVQPKLIRRQAEWRYSALTEPFLGDEDLFLGKPRTFEDREAARQNQILLNWQFQTKLNAVQFIDNYVRSTVDEGTSIARLGWKRVTAPVKQIVPEFTHYPIQSEEQLDQLMQAEELRQMDPRTYEETVSPELKAACQYYAEHQMPTYAIKTGEREITVQKVVENHPTVEVKNPANIYIDPSCNGDLDKALFVIESFETSEAELKKEGKKYKNLDKVNWDGNNPLSTPDHETSTPQDFQLADRLRKKVVAYEYWGFYDVNGDGTLVPIVCTWIGDTIIRLELNPFPDEKVPYVVVPYLPVKRELFGEPDAELLEDNQAILGAVSRGMIDLLGRSANSQQGFAKGMLDPLNRRRFENGEDYEFNPNVNPQQGHIQHKYPELPQSALLMVNMQNQEAEALTGVKSFAGGMSGQAYGDVAAGIRGVLDAASKREMAILRRLAKGMQQIGIKIAAMNAIFLSEEEVVRVTNDKFVTIRREDLKGNFDIKIDISTAEANAAKVEKLGFVLQTIGPNEDPEIRRMVLAEIADLMRMPDLARKFLTYQPQPTPEQQQLQQLEIQLKMKEVEKLQSEIDLNNAKARQAVSDADRKDLDFVETETGTKHARELEKQVAQSRGNQNLQVTKALTSPVKDGEKEPNIEAAVGFNELSEQLARFG